MRYGLAIASIRYGSGTTLAGTFAANMIGCLMIGMISGLVVAHPDWIHPRLSLGIRVGLLGGLTTFSTFAAESVIIGKEGRSVEMFAYIAASVIVGLALVWIGMWATESSIRRHLIQLPDHFMNQPMHRTDQLRDSSPNGVVSTILPASRLVPWIVECSCKK